MRKNQVGCVCGDSIDRLEFDLNDDILCEIRLSDRCFAARNKRETLRLWATQTVKTNGRLLCGWTKKKRPPGRGEASELGDLFVFCPDSPDPIRKKVKSRRRTVREIRGHEP